MSKFKLFKSPAGEAKKHAYETPLEKKLANVLNPFQEFSQSLIMSSILLLGAIVAALIMANVPVLIPYYKKIVNFQIHIVLGDYRLGGSVKYWVNEILLTFFFFLVGLEIKREFIAGELVNRKRSTLVLFAAAGGMLIPAVIFIFINYGLPTSKGWAIPMATDTAFALGILTIFKKKLPDGVFTFMAALAIIDDIGAIIVIIVFYTQQISILYLLLAVFCLALLIFSNYAGIRHSIFYLIGGGLLWYTLKYAGIHGVIAGVLVAFCIPARPAKGPRAFVNKITALLNYFDKRKEKIPKVIEDEKQHIIIEQVEETAKYATTPLQRLESALDLPISLFVLPLFAFLNAGIVLNYNVIEASLHSELTWGIMLGLLLGKPLGITLMCFIALKLNIGTMPKETTFKQLVGASLLGGIGFTMSLFISNLAFASQEQLLELAKSGVLFGSFFAGIIGVVWLFILKN